MVIVCWREERDGGGRRKGEVGFFQNLKVKFYSHFAKFFVECLDAMKLGR